MPEKLLTIIGSLPFMLLVTDEKGKRFLQVNKIRIIESAISACVTGAVVGVFMSYVSLKNVEIKLEAIEKKVEVIDTRLWQVAQEIER